MFMFINISKYLARELPILVVSFKSALIPKSEIRICWSSEINAGLNILVVVNPRLNNFQLVEKDLRTDSEFVFPESLNQLIEIAIPLKKKLNSWRARSVEGVYWVIKGDGGD